MSKPTAPAYYVVFEGWVPGIYDDVIKFKMNTNGYPKANFRKFNSREDAQRAFQQYQHKNPKTIFEKLCKKNEHPAIYTDVRCWSNPGAASYKSILIGNDGIQILLTDELSYSTSNVTEFMALANTLIHCKENNINTRIYTKSTTAISWVKKRSCNTDLTFNQQTKATHKRIENAVRWLEDNQYDNAVLKYEMNPDIEFALNIKESHIRSA